MRALLLLLCLVSQAWGATKYVRNTCQYNGNGNAEDCATSAGASGAYNTGASVFFSQVGAGNTLYLYRGTTISDWAGTIVDTAITIDDYGPASASCPVWTKASGSQFQMSINADDVTVNDICITGNSTSAVVSTVKARTIFNRVKVYGNATTSGIGVRFNNSSSDGQLNDSEVYNIDDDGVGISATATGTFVLSNVNCHDIDKGNSSGDCVQAYDGTAASLTVIGGTYIRDTGNKQAIRYSGSGTLLVKGKPKLSILRDGAQGISADGTGILDIRSVYIKSQSTSPAIFTHNSGTSQIYGAIIDGGGYGVWSSHATGALTITQSSIRGQSIASVYHTTDGAGGTTTVKNSYIDGPTNIYDAHASATTVSDYNRFGPSQGAFRWNGTEYGSLGAWQAVSSQDANSLGNVTPGFIGGNAPSSPDGFRLSSTSTLFRAVPALTGYHDYRGCRFENPASVGAFERCAGDAR